MDNRFNPQTGIKTLQNKSNAPKISKCKISDDIKKAIIEFKKKSINLGYPYL